MLRARLVSALELWLPLADLGATLEAKVYEALWAAVRIRAHPPAARGALSGVTDPAEWTISLLIAQGYLLPLNEKESISRAPLGAGSEIDLVEWNRREVKRQAV